MFLCIPGVESLEGLVYSLVSGARKVLSGPCPLPTAVTAADTRRRPPLLPVMNMNQKSIDFYGRLDVLRFYRFSGLQNAPQHQMHYNIRFWGQLALPNIYTAFDELIDQSTI